MFMSRVTLQRLPGVVIFRLDDMRVLSLGRTE